MKIAQTLSRSLQCGIVFMKIDAVVYAHNCHRHNTDNREKSEDCKGRKEPPSGGYHSVIRPCVPSPLSHRMQWTEEVRVHCERCYDDTRGNL